MPTPAADYMFMQSAVTMEDRLRLQRLFTTCNHTLYGSPEAAEAAGCAWLMAHRVVCCLHFGTGPAQSAAALRQKPPGAYTVLADGPLFRSCTCTNREPQY